MRILAIDPGGTTGLVVGNLLDNKGGFQLYPDQRKLLHKGMYDYLVETDPDGIIYESFEYRNRARPGLELISAELIGVILLYATQHDKPLRKQTASYAGAGGKNGHFNNRKLKALGYYDSRQHAMDALRHILMWYNFGPGYKYYCGQAVVNNV